MKTSLQPWHLAFLFLTGWVNGGQQGAIGYLRAEDPIFQEKLGKKRTLLNDDQRRRPAAKGKIPGRRCRTRLPGS